MTTSTITGSPPNEPAVEGHTYLATHRIGGDVLRYLLSFEESRLHELAASSPAGRAGKTLAKAGALRITQLALQKDMRLPWHEVGGPACIQLLRGRLQIFTADGRMDLTPGALVIIDAGVQHSAVAMSDCVMLITISMNEAMCE